MPQLTQLDTHLAGVLRRYLFIGIKGHCLQSPPQWSPSVQGHLTCTSVGKNRVGLEQIMDIENL